MKLVEKEENVEIQVVTKRFTTQLGKFAGQDTHHWGHRGCHHTLKKTDGSFKQDDRIGQLHVGFSYVLIYRRTLHKKVNQTMMHTDLFYLT